MVITNPTERPVVERLLEICKEIRDNDLVLETTNTLPVLERLDDVITEAEEFIYATQPVVMPPL